MLQQVGFGVKFIKDYNELNVLRFIKNHGPISRAEISKKQHISKAGISEEIASMLSDDQNIREYLPSLKTAASYNKIASKIFGYK